MVNLRNKHYQEVMSTHTKKIARLLYKEMDVDEHIQNISSYDLSFFQKLVLCRGLKFAFPQRVSSIEVKASFEEAYWSLEPFLGNDDLRELAAATLRFVALNYIQRKVQKPSKTLLLAIEQLKQRDDIVITKPDKGSVVVVMDKSEYLRLLSEASINDSSKFRAVPLERPSSKGRPPTYYHPLLQKEKELESIVRRILPKPIADTVRPTGSRLAHLYGLPKTHKDRLEIANGDILVSYDVSSLFTNVPLDETIQLLANRAFTNNWFNTTYDLNLTKRDLVDRLLSVASKGQLFQFNGALYEQTDGVAMGWPLGPLLANVFMSHIEENVEREGKLPSFYRRYVDDTLTIMPNKETASNFLDTLNQAHFSVKFTMETECNGMLPFLGIQLLNRSPQIETKVYVKPTNSGLLLHYQSHVDNRYKKGLLRTMLDRTHRLSSSWSDECDRLKTVFLRLKYPKHLSRLILNSTIKSFVDSKVCDQQQPLSPSQEKDDTIQVVLPFKDQISADIVRKQLKDLSLKVHTTIQPVFVSRKIEQELIVKETKPPIVNQQCVVYGFQCDLCDAGYVGYTRGHLHNRVKGHKQQSSAIAKHYKNMHGTMPQGLLERFKLLKDGVTFDTLNTSGTIPVEIDLLKINANGLEMVLEANLTNLFGISNDDFLLFKQEKKLATHSSVTGDRNKLCRGVWLISPHGSPSIL
ncbi:uncharacterized protein [Montipora capricornis]|uniref:uncharacterized protein n=1 Tax=Montipora capricornis TaxID=246305 RepID=UPI0035F1A11F